MNSKKMTIKEAAARINRSPQTVLNWEQEGLITPARNDRGWRIFTEEDVKLLEKIREAKMVAMITGGKTPEGENTNE